MRGAIFKDENERTADRIRPPNCVPRQEGGVFLDKPGSGAQDVLEVRILSSRG